MGAAPLRVLASAYACEPGRGSEPGIGWNLARQIALRHELTLVTRENNVEAVERAAAEEALRIEVVGHDLPASMRFWKRGARGAMPYYVLWQKSLAGVARDLCQDHRFDLVHHLTFASGWLPSGLARTGLPFVLGPVGEHPRVPQEFLRSGDWRARSGEFLRATARRTFPWFERDVRETWNAADVILSLGRTFGDRIPRVHRGRVVSMLAAGTEPESFRDPLPRAAGAPLSCVFTGRLVDLKGVRIAVHAFALAFAGGPETFDLYGDGPERAHLEELARELGVARQVRFHGHVPHAEAVESMRAADVFLFPSFEGGGMVVPEAMAAGACVVCLDFGGPGEMVGASRGVAVPPEDGVEATASEISKVLRRLAADEPKRLRIAEEGQEWARRVTTWTSKGARLNQVYARAIENARARRNDAQRAEAA
ncbi:MAG: glycosyltransferase family 4 protein [Planctomycetota bacterium]